MKRTEGEGRGSDNIRLTLSLSGMERRAYRVLLALASSSKGDVLSDSLRD